MCNVQAVSSVFSGATAETTSVTHPATTSPATTQPKTTQPMTTQSLTTEGITKSPSIGRTAIIVIIVVGVFVAVVLLAILIALGARAAAKTAAAKTAASQTRPAAVEGLPKVSQPRRYGNWLPEAPGSVAALMHRYPHQSPPVIRWYATQMPSAAAAGRSVASPQREPLIVVHRAPFGQLRSPPYFSTPSGYFYRPTRLVLTPKFG